MKYWAGLKIFLFSGNIVDPHSLFGLRPIYSYMDRDQSNDYLVEIGVESESTFVNTFSFQLTILLFMGLHTIVLIVYWKMRPFNEVEKKIVRKVVKLLFNLFTFDLSDEFFNIEMINQYWKWQIEYSISTWINMEWIAQR